MLIRHQTAVSIKSFHSPKLLHSFQLHLLSFSAGGFTQEYEKNQKKIKQ